MEDQLQAEPKVEYNGNVSDLSEHRQMLFNAEANNLSDQNAIQTGLSLGFSRQELENLILGPEDLDFLDGSDDSSVEKFAKSLLPKP